VLCNIHEAKTHLSRLLEQVERGEEVIIGRAGRPIARLVPYEPRVEPRRPGAMRGRITIPPDFDATPDWLVEEFEGDGE
jgi:prevent-host-death family protein